MHVMSWVLFIVTFLWSLICHLSSASHVLLHLLHCPSLGVQLIPCFSFLVLLPLSIASSPSHPQSLLSVVSRLPSSLYRITFIVRGVSHPCPRISFAVHCPLCTFSIVQCNIAFRLFSTIPSSIDILCPTHLTPFPRGHHLNPPP